MSNNSYIAVLEESLAKKANILMHLQLLCEKQSDILDDENMTPEMFEENVQEKEILILKLTQLDDGFEQLYKRVRKEMADNKDEYKDSIRHMQDLIRDVTSRSIQIQAIEARNKEKAERRFGEIRSQIREVKHSGRAVSNYYQNMMKMNAVEPQFWDSKK